MTQPLTTTRTEPLKDAMPDTLSVVDNRTGKKYELPIQDGTIRAMDLRQMKTGSEDFGLMTYDPAFMKDRKSTRLNSSHIQKSRMPSSA